jgi:ankyrin repeat protein
MYSYRPPQALGDYPQRWVHPVELHPLEKSSYLDDPEEDDIFAPPPIPVKSPRRKKREIVITELEYNDSSDSQSSTTASPTSPSTIDMRPPPTPHFAPTAPLPPLLQESVNPPVHLLQKTTSHPATPTPAPARKRLFRKLLTGAFDGIGGKSNIGNPQEKGLTSLHRAALKGDVERVNFLLSDTSVAIDPNARRRGCTGWEESVLYLAIVGGNADIVATLIDAGAKMDESCIEDFHRSRPLHRAALSRSTSCLEMLLVRGADMHAVDLHEKTALHIAAEAGRVDAADMLLHHGARIDVLAAYWMTPLYLACKHGHASVVNLLVSHGADVERHSNEWKDNTLLHQAVLSPVNRGAACLQHLLQAGAAVDVMDKRGNTPLHLASSLGRADCVGVLLDWGADIARLTDPPDFGEGGKMTRQTPLQMALAAKKQCVDTIAALRLAESKRGGGGGGGREASIRSGISGSSWENGRGRVARASMNMVISGRTSVAASGRNSIVASRRTLTRIDTKASSAGSTSSQKAESPRKSFGNIEENGGGRIATVAGGGGG